MPQENMTPALQKFIAGWGQPESISLPAEALPVGWDDRNGDYPKAIYEWDGKYILTCGSILVSINEDSQKAMQNMIDLVKICHICHYPTFRGLDNICEHAK